MWYSTSYSFPVPSLNSTMYLQLLSNSLNLVHIIEDWSYDFCIRHEFWNIVHMAPGFPYKHRDIWGWVNMNQGHMSGILGCYLGVRNEKDIHKLRFMIWIFFISLFSHFFVIKLIYCRHKILDPLPLQLLYGGSPMHYNFLTL